MARDKTWSPSWLRPNGFGSKFQYLGSTLASAVINTCPLPSFHAPFSLLLLSPFFLVRDQRAGYYSDHDSPKAAAVTLECVGRMVLCLHQFLWEMWVISLRKGRHLSLLTSTFCLLLACWHFVNFGVWSPCFGHVPDNNWTCFKSKLFRMWYGMFFVGSNLSKFEWFYLGNLLK